jgi:protein-tyrosine-phosphatase
MRPKFRVLFLCTRNSDRSIFAEYFLRSMGGDRFEAYSEGEAPRGEAVPADRVSVETAHRTLELPTDRKTRSSPT